MLSRALIKTHHMTSRKKIASLTKSASSLSVSVLLKTGRSPGVMLCEGDESSVEIWVERVKRLRYKDYQLMVRERLEPQPDEGQGLEAVAKRGSVREIEELKAFSALLAEADDGLLLWWKRGMGYVARKG